MRITNNLRRRAVTWATAGLAVTAVAGALGLTAASAAPVTSARHSGAFTFGLVPSPGIKSCLPHAGGQYHLGLWFNDPNVPYNLGCEPNGPGTRPIVTPFNGEQHAGIQALNTAQFPDGAGPLSHVHR